MRWRSRPGKSMVKRTMAWLGVTTSTVAGVLVVAVSPALAASDAEAVCWWDTLHTDTCGYAYFKSEVGDGTEKLTIEDDLADGYGVAVENYRYDLANTGPYYGLNRKGAGTTVDYILHIPEGTRFAFRVCPEKDGIAYLDYCGVWANGYA